MTITYNWEFPTLRVKLSQTNLQNVVYLVDWVYSGKNIAGNQVSSYGQVTVSAPDPAKFTPFEQLTKAQVQGWVENVLGQERIDAMKNSIARQLQEITAPTEAARQSPWVKP